MASKCVANLTDEERILGRNEGFPPVPLPPFVEEFPGDDGLDLPNDTGTAPHVVENEPLITLPPEDVVPDVVTMGEAPDGFTGDWDRLTEDERRFVERETAGGRTVEAIPTGPDRTPDFRIDGVPTELKTIRPESSEPDQVSASIARAALDGRGQSGHVVIDASNVEGLTREVAERGTVRAFAADSRAGLESIRVIGADVDITVPRIYD